MNHTTSTVWRCCRAVLPFLPLLLPALLLLRLIRAHAVNIPFLDDWMYVSMDEKLKAGTLTVHDFFAAQMEHRMAFVRAVIMLFHKLWPADYVKQMWFSFTLLTLTFINVAVLVRITVRDAVARTCPLLLLASLAIFSPVQYQIVLWAMMFQVACPAFFLSTALVTLRSRLPAWAMFLICLVCGECATQSFSTGLLLWPLVVPAIWWSSSIPTKEQRVIFTAAWIASCVITMGLYLHNLHNEVDPSFAYKQEESETLHRDFGAFLRNPAHSFLFIVRFLGGHLGRGTSASLMQTSLVIGALSFACFLAAFGWWIANFRREELRRAMLPWLIFGSYSIGAAVLVAAGRAWVSDSGDNVLLPRYVIHAVPLTVSLVMLAAIMTGDLRRGLPDRLARLPQLAACSGVVLGCVLLLNWIHGATMMEVWESSRLRVATNTLFYDKLKMFDGDVSTKRDYARRADALGLLNPPMVKSLRLDQFSRSSEVLHGNSAMWTGLTVEHRKNKDGNDESYGVASGYATLPRRERVADGVFLAWKDPADAHWEIFHVAQVSAMPLYLLQTLSRDMQNIHVGGDLNKDVVAGFGGRFHFSAFDSLPKGKHEVSAWAFDYKLRKVYPMGGFFEVNTSDNTVRPLGDDPVAVKHQRN